jgi:molybdate transport system substrate-binding protein
MLRNLIWSTFLALATVFTAHAAPSYPSPDTEDLTSPPWQFGDTAPSLGKGLELTLPHADNLADFHGDLTGARLILFVGTGYYFAMPLLLASFEDEHPELEGRVYYETLAAGVLAKQIRSGGRVTVGNMTWVARPDAYLGELTTVKRLIETGDLVGPPVSYATNRLAIMVPRGNPAQVHNLADLGRPGIHIAMPNPEYGGLPSQIEAALTKAGGPALVSAVFDMKVRQGTTLLTHLHHRQTPVWLMDGRSEAGVVWRSETVFDEQVGLPTERVEIRADQNITSTCGGALMKDALNNREARLWLDFLQGDKARAIFARYGLGEFPPMTEAHLH